ncbi:glycosyltransferase [Dyadobacter sp. CY323]|uniref:glycosyltransferase n=1 Tax=Dyadobacter sp. CY323 TaxID=2907302 RepID=UPI001F16B439|nr:glycosyltransferase [Dyadobacter sp. CY323]MCE6989092.1 glycosyltransferase [Dyadobacter sp. CY323]
MKPRVLLVSTVHPATDPRIFYKIASSISADYEVFCVLPRANETVNHPFRNISLPYFRRLVWRLFVSHPVMLWKCLRLKPDVVHIFVPELIPAALLFQFRGAKIVYEVQENLFKKFSIKRFNNAFFFQYFFKLFDSTARKRFNCIFTDEAYLTEYRILSKPYAIVRNFVSVPFIDAIPDQKGNPQARYEFFYAGVISLERCFDVLLEALYLLNQTYPEFHVHLFGPIRVDLNKWKENPHYLSVCERITLYGYRDQKFAFSHARRCIAGIALLKPVADYQESYTTKLFDYMSLNLPVITSDFPLYRQVVEHSHCGFCISPYNAQTLCEKFVWLIENPEDRKRMGRNGRKAIIDTYNWAREELTLFSFYKNLLKH